MKNVLSKQNLLLFFILLVVILPAIFSLLHKGFFVTDDGEWMIIRFSAFYASLHDGQFPVRFLHRLNFDYGYPVATFLYPGFMYFGVVFHLFRFGFVETIKIILGLSFVGSTVFIYLWLGKIFQKSAAVIGAIVALYVPYHLYDVYVRGSVGEVFALLWVSFILWMIERKDFFFVSIGIFLLILSHNTMAVFFLPLLFLYALLRKIVSLKQLFLSFFLGISLSAFFILPTVFELALTQFAQTAIANPFAYFADIHLIGFATIFIGLLALMLFITRHKSSKNQKNIVLLFLVLTFVSIFFSSSWSGFFWHVIPSAFIQFPFRLLSYLIISTAFLTAFIISEVIGWKKAVIIVVLVGIVIFSAVPFVTPKAYFDKGEGYYSTNEATTTVKDEYMPVWVKQKPLQRPANKIEIPQGEGKVSHVFYNNKVISFTVHTKKKTLITIHTIYWPGWIAFLDGKETTISYNNPRGLMQVLVPSGMHDVQVRFQETPVRLVSDFVSLLSLGILIFVTIFARKKQ